jgi:hypothetical protein
MRVSEIIRNILDLIDQADGEEIVNNIDPQPEGYEDNDIKRFRQIVDVADTDEVEGYANTPNEKLASIDAVTTDAGSDTWQGTKDVDDIRGTTTRIHGNN